MIRLATPKWRELVAGLALLLVFPVLANTSWHDENYVLLMDFQNPNLSRLLVFSSGSSRLTPESLLVIGLADDQIIALDMTRSANAAQRVRGLTLLSGVDSALALNAALVLLSDPVVAVREEAIHLVFAHPDADIESIAAIGQKDPSVRVRELTTELIAQRFEK